MCSGSEAGSYLRLIDFYHSTLGLRVIKKKAHNLLERRGSQEPPLDYQAFVPPEIRG